MIERRSGMAEPADAADLKSAEGNLVGARPAGTKKEYSLSPREAFSCSKLLVILLVGAAVGCEPATAEIGLEHSADAVLVAGDAGTVEILKQRDGVFTGQASQGFEAAYVEGLAALLLELGS
jgi:hypothetical protein